jgi:hypothetical protein
MTCFREPSLADLLNDSITRAVMRADGVDPRELETCLRDLAARRTDSSQHAASGWRSRLQMCGAP